MDAVCPPSASQWPHRDRQTPNNEWMARRTVSALQSKTMYAHASMTPAAHARLTGLLLIIATLVAVVLGVYGSQAW